MTTDIQHTAVSLLAEHFGADSLVRSQNPDNIEAFLDSLHRSRYAGL